MNWVIKMKRKIYSGITWLLLAVILPIPLISVLNHGLIDTPSHIFAIDMGIAAYVWWLADIFLATRPRWLLNKIGMPNNYLLHGIIAVMAILAATFHKFNLSTFHAIIKNTGNIAWYLELVLMVYAIVFMSGWLTERIPAVLKFKCWVNRLLTHQVSLWLHRLNFVVLALIWLHVQVIPRINNVSYFNLLFNIYTAVFVLLYLYKKIVSDADPKQVGTVKDNAVLTSNIQKLTIELNLKAKPYKAGDFYFLSFKDKNVTSERHPFSVLSRPNNRTAEFIIQKTGDFTRQIEKVSAGSKVQMEGPFGLFNNEVKESNGPVILYGLSSGIAPLMSLAAEYVGKKQLHIIWSTNSKEEFLQNKLAELKNLGVTVDVQQHRFTQEQLQKILRPEEINSGQYFIVGSNQVVPKIRKNLKKLGIKSNQLHDEHLTM